jgi:hypothetical protein
MIAARQRQAADRRPYGTGTHKKAGRCGTARISKGAAKALDAGYEKIVNSLLNGAIRGNVNSGKFLLTLAEWRQEVDDEGAKRVIRSIASELAAEPEWQGEPDEAGGASCPGDDELKN